MTRYFNTFFPIDNIRPSTAVSTTAVNLLDAAGSIVTGSSVTLHCLTGNLWIYPNGTATTANGYKMLPNTAVDLTVTTKLSLISDATGATYQSIKWAI